MNDKDAIVRSLQMLQSAVFVLQRELPNEQKRRGSELQQIDALANELYHKYVADNAPDGGE